MSSQTSSKSEKSYRQPHSDPLNLQHCIKRQRIQRTQRFFLVIKNLSSTFRSTRSFHFFNDSALVLNVIYDITYLIPSHHFNPLPSHLAPSRKILLIIPPFFQLPLHIFINRNLFVFYYFSFCPELRRYHEDRMINYDHEDGVSVSSKLTSSILTVRNATARHGGKWISFPFTFTATTSKLLTFTSQPRVFFLSLGNYTCAPANARQSSIYVHVLKGS